MVEIVNRGRKPEDDPGVVECSNCKSTLRLTRGEAKWTHDQRDGSWGELKCPVCEGRVVVYPNHFKTQADTVTDYYNK